MCVCVRESACVRACVCVGVCVSRNKVLRGGPREEAIFM